MPVRNDTDPVVEVGTHRDRIWGRIWGRIWDRSVGSRSTRRSGRSRSRRPADTHRCDKSLVGADRPDRMRNPWHSNLDGMDRGTDCTEGVPEWREEAAPTVAERLNDSAVDDVYHHGLMQRAYLP